MKVLYLGAESRISKEGSTLFKERIPKGYRHPGLDKALRRMRTKSEASILARLEKMHFPAPRLLSVHDAQLSMDYLKGKRLVDVLEEENFQKLSLEIGRKVAVLHQHNIIHGDLTTSNMILVGEIYFIDFGLSFISAKPEDRAVDLHLLRQALESKHHTIWHECFEEVKRGYTGQYDKARDVLLRLEKVEARGRNKGKR
ncbi:Kae1-associated kinase Bud32 [Candidatus Woesearchaeota archaeon CG_4_10_14_0_8_um_filter_47_5]|nr:MAG: Kae1-associated kinase Bud32 [Candidatus Woesearchaeota archaeon CG_4_10_14_0_8_um_filter_47_5]